MSSSIRGAVVAILTFAGNTLCGTLCIAMGEQNSTVAREIGGAMVCGRNSLYVLLALNALQADYDQVCRALPVSAKGVSLLQMRDAAAQFGLKTRVVRGGYEMVRQSDQPLIALMRRTSDAGVGHFVVVLRTSNVHVDCIDGTTGERVEWKPEVFSEYWMGIALMPQSPNPRRLRPIGLLWPSIILVATFCVFARSRFRSSKRQRRETRRGRAVTLLITMAVLIWPSCAGAMSEEIDRWRSADRELVNAIYMSLRYYGLPGEYSSVCTAFPTVRGQCSLQQMCDIACQFGLDMAVYHCESLEDIWALPFPTITHLDAPLETRRAGAARHGTLSVPIGRTARGDYYLCNCGTLSFSRVSEETFRRHWSGYVVVCRPKSNEAAMDAVAAIISSIIGIEVIVAYTRWARRVEGEVEA